ncbi:MAG TPA: MBL fold metallo-hydrolase, partial [Candidatus Gallibacteroides avistercoris]|nr:MBL fold metallo-hydrolase [Candidatus Gallibacteroides avistercoris]
MVIKKFEFNPFPVNTYVLWDEKSKEAVIIDAGCYFEE